jgi:hypothetical protein
MRHTLHASKILDAYRRGVNEGIFEVAVPADQLLLKKLGIRHALKDPHQDGVGRRYMLEMNCFEPHIRKGMGRRMG